MLTVGARMRRNRWWALPAAVLILSVALGGCLEDAEDQCYVFDNPNDPSASTVCTGGEPVDTGTGSSSVTIAYIDTANEIVVIVNQGDQALDMSLWTLEAENSGDIFTFPTTFTLQLGSLVRIRTGSGTDDTDDLYWAGIDHWTSSIDTATLRDSDNNVSLVCSFTSSIAFDC